MSSINPYQDIETRRQYRNQTTSQQRKISELKEGVIVNSMIKDQQTEQNVETIPSIENMYDNLVIPEKTTKTDIFEFKNKEPQKEQSLHRSLAPILATTVGLFGLLSGSMYIMKRAAIYKTSLKPWQTLQEITKHVSVNDEPHLAMLLMIRDPNFRNIMGALGVFVLSAAGFVGKNYVDGIKEV